MKVLKWNLKKNSPKICSDKGLTLKTSALKLFIIAKYYININNKLKQLILNYPVTLSH